MDLDVVRARGRGRGRGGARRCGRRRSRRRGRRGIAGRRERQRRPRASVTRPRRSTAGAHEEAAANAKSARSVSGRGHGVRGLRTRARVSARGGPGQGRYSAAKVSIHPCGSHSPAVGIERTLRVPEVDAHDEQAGRRLQLLDRQRGVGSPIEGPNGHLRDGSPGCVELDDDPPHALVILPVRLHAQMGGCLRRPAARRRARSLLQEEPPAPARANAAAAPGHAICQPARGAGVIDARSTAKRTIASSKVEPAKSRSRSEMRSTSKPVGVRGQRQASVGARRRQRPESLDEQPRPPTEPCVEPAEEEGSATRQRRGGVDRGPLGVGLERGACRRWARRRGLRETRGPPSRRRRCRGRSRARRAAPTRARRPARERDRAGSRASWPDRRAQSSTRGHSATWGRGPRGRPPRRSRPPPGHRRGRRATRRRATGPGPARRARR